MTPFRTTWLAACVLSCAASACALGPEPDWQPMPPPPAASQELAQKTRELYASLSNGQRDQASLLYSQEPGRVFIGLGGNDVGVTSEPRGAATSEFFVEPGSAIVPGEVVDRPTVTLANGTVLHLRLTLLWRNEYGIWKIVHSHASLAH
jgi:hypothetical protein